MPSLSSNVHFINLFFSRHCFYILFFFHLVYFLCSFNFSLFYLLSFFCIRFTLFSFISYAFLLSVLIILNLIFLMSLPLIPFPFFTEYICSLKFHKSLVVLIDLICVSVTRRPRGNVISLRY
jgi:hypothetical protein